MMDVHSIFVFTLQTISTTVSRRIPLHRLLCFLNQHVVITLNNTNTIPIRFIQSKQLLGLCEQTIQCKDTQKMSALFLKHVAKQIFNPCYIPRPE